MLTPAHPRPPLQDINDAFERAMVMCARLGIGMDMDRAGPDLLRPDPGEIDRSRAVHIHANAKTGAHHHGALESVIYVLKGRARMRWGEHLEYVAEANPGDFIFIPPYVPHQEINASTDETLECVLVRSDNEAVVVNLDIEPVEKPEEVAWVDPIHKG